MKDAHEKFGQSDYEIKEREILYQGKLRLVRLTLRHRLFDGAWGEFFIREILERPRASAVLPYDPILDRVILIEQFRAGAIADPESPWLIEIPAGLIENPAENPETVALRETEEEAGGKITNIKLLYEYFVSPGGSNEYIYLFYGEVDASHIAGIHGLANEHENIRVLNLSAEEAFAKLKNKEIKNAPAILALEWLKSNRQSLKKNQ